MAKTFSTLETNSVVTMPWIFCTTDGFRFREISCDRLETFKEWSKRKKKRWKKCKKKAHAVNLSNISVPVSGKSTSPWIALQMRQGIAKYIQVKNLPVQTSPRQRPCTEHSPRFCPYSHLKQCSLIEIYYRWCSERTNARWWWVFGLCTLICSDPWAFLRLPPFAILIAVYLLDSSNQKEFCEPDKHIRK